MAGSNNSDFRYNFVFNATYSSSSNSLVHGSCSCKENISTLLILGKLQCFQTALLDRCQPIDWLSELCHLIIKSSFPLKVLQWHLIPVCIVTLISQPYFLFIL